MVSVGCERCLGLLDKRMERLIISPTSRLPFINAVVLSYNSLMAAHRGEVVCVITTAKALDEAGKKVGSPWS